MSKSTSKSKTPHLINKKPPFSTKEIAIMREEARDPAAYQRNSTLLISLFQNHPLLRTLLIKTDKFMDVMDIISQKQYFTGLLGGNLADEDAEIKKIIAKIAEETDYIGLLGALISVYKNTKIKREKRVLLWAIGLMISMATDAHPVECPTIYLYILSSFKYSKEMMATLHLVIDGIHPSNFNYKKILDGQFNKEDRRTLIQTCSFYEPHLTRYCDSFSRSLFDWVKKPFGLRFHRILNYGRIAPYFEKRHILTPDPSPNENPLDPMSEETLRHTASVILLDFQIQEPTDQCRDLLQSIQAAAFGEVKQEKFEQALNAAAYCFLGLNRINTFCADVYTMSGQHALELNPPDEHSLIIDLKSAPDNPRLFRKYGDLLYEKGEVEGAIRAYFCYSNMDNNPDETIIQRVNDSLQEIFSRT